MATQTTIRVRVPNQEFESILLVVGPETTLRHVISEINSQLYGDCTLYTKREPQVRASIRALPFGENTEPVLFMRDWTMYQIISTGAKEFEYFHTDLIQ